jgi:hypothetical protein
MHATEKLLKPYTGEATFYFCLFSVSLKGLRNKLEWGYEEAESKWIYLIHILNSMWNDKWKPKDTIGVQNLCTELDIL